MTNEIKLGQRGDGEMENQIRESESCTPGPWGVGIDEENSDRIEIVYRGEDPSQLEHIAEIYFSIPNAHLIAAAPELRAACKMAIIEMSKGNGLSICNQKTIRNELNAAITKAECGARP